MDDLAADPKNKQQILAMAKAKYPNQPIPEYDIPKALEETQIAPLREEIKGLTGKLAEVTGQLAERDEREKLTSLVGADDVVEVRKLMDEKGITNPETAAEHLRLARQTAPPRAMPSLTFDTGNLKDWMADPRGKAMKEAEAALADIIRARR